MTVGSEFGQPGAIVRIRLQNFMTYSDIELLPGPNLNMILGPNGTGKSAVVCSIIVGLAGEVALTGRATSPAGLVKKGTDWASTEIELYNDEPRKGNYIVYRKIIITGRSEVKIDHKSEWKLNGKPCLKATIQELSKKLNIKVDNLCQFLPQDSVAAFVKMNSCELLTSTLKAAGDNELVDDHVNLINYTTEIREKSDKLAKLQESFQENQVNCRRLEADVDEYRQKEALREEKNTCSLKIHYVKYLDAKISHDNIKQERGKLQEEMDRIESTSEPFRRAADLSKEEETRLREAAQRCNDEMRSANNLIIKEQSAIDNRKIDCQREFSTFKSKLDEENHREQMIQLKRQEIESLECKLNEARNVDCSNQISQIEKELAITKEERLSCNRDRAETDETLRHLISSIESIRRECDNILSVNEKKKAIIQEKFRHAHMAMEWLSKNMDRFQKPIFMPMLCEINVKDQRYAKIVENAISTNDLIAFVCQTEDDLKTFTRITRVDLKYNINVILMPDQTTEEFQSQAQSQNCDFSHLGFKKRLIDLLDAPEPIMRYLCQANNFHRVPVADNCTESDLKQMLSCCTKFYAGNNFYSVSKSRYDQKPMIVTDTIREANLLKYSLDKTKLNEYMAKLDQKKNERQEAQLRRDDLSKRENDIADKWHRLAEQHRQMMEKQEEKKRIETLLEKRRISLARLEEEKIDIEQARTQLCQAIDKINQRMIKHLDDMVKYNRNLAELRITYTLDMLLMRLARRNVRLNTKQYKQSRENVSRLDEEIKRKDAELRRVQAVLKEALERAQEKITGFKDGKFSNKRMKEKLRSIELNTVEDLERRVESLKVKINTMSKDSGLLDDYNRQCESLAGQTQKIKHLEACISKMNNERTAIKNNWLPKLREVIEVIDGHYQNFMRSLSYDGKVELDYDPAEPDNFSVYGISIKVKYRDNEQLIPLTSTRQSGGERSVATMIYMLALQTKTTVPFRCVDEINQGMDKENERKVFELLVQTADASSSQYFLVSPKLLSNLPYSEKMKIHIVFNGKKSSLAWN